MRSQDALGQALHVASGGRKEAMSDAWRGERFGRAAWQQERAEAWELYARSHRATTGTARLSARFASAASVVQKTSLWPLAKARWRIGFVLQFPVRAKYIWPPSFDVAPLALFLLPLSQSDA
jgi:hypothetical protein